jgi:hypothetical protein
MNPKGLINAMKIKKEKEKGDECQLTQREANTLFEGTPVDAANNISNYMVLIMTCIFYSPIIPLAIPLGMVGSITNYWVYKYMLLRKHKMPEMFSDMMATFFASFMPVVIIVWGIAFCVFIDKITKAYYADFSKALNTEVEKTDAWAQQQLSPDDITALLGILGLTLSVVCFVSPFGVIKKVFDTCHDESKFQDEKYENVILTFSTDYDKENPLTIKSGQLRLLAY